jgi:DNA-binding CsgD family transcriptional regulator
MAIFETGPAGWFMNRLLKSIQEKNDQSLSHQVLPEDIDSSLVETNISFAQKLVSIRNCAVSVYDYCSSSFLFTSTNIFEVFGCEEGENTRDLLYFQKQVHPDDYHFFAAEVKANNYLSTVSPEQRKDFLLTHFFRFRSDNGEWLQMTSQQYILELDKKGNPWLRMKVYDQTLGLQQEWKGSSILSNMLTKEIVFTMFADAEIERRLTAREKEILHHIAAGMTSQEIASALFISVNTVNNHRKNILSKLEVASSSEAISKIAGFG